MKQKIHFISGLPRSGSTLLAGILRQNPVFHAGMSSPVAQLINAMLLAMGKDERAISVSGYVHRGQVKYSDVAFNKTAIYKQKSRNHLLEQIEAFRIGDSKSKREDDLIDAFCYGIAIAIGNEKGF